MIPDELIDGRSRICCARLRVALKVSAIPPVVRSRTLLKNRISIVRRPAACGRTVDSDMDPSNLALWWKHFIEGEPLADG